MSQLPPTNSTPLDRLDQLLRQRWNRRFLIGFGLAAIALLSVLATPAQAIQAQLQPSSPQLGDTLVVSMQGNYNTAPTVTLGQKTYTSFATGNNRYRAFVPTTPLDRPGRVTLQVNGNGESQTLTTTLRDRSFPTQSISLGAGGGPEGTDYEFDRVDAFKALVTPEKFWNGKLLRPSNAEISTGYGVRRYYNGVFAEDYYHRGVDYAGDTGSPIVAPAAGRIALLGREADGFEIHGNVVGIDHGQGVLSIMLHLSRFDVKEGDMVTAGQRIGAIGSTGAATGPHLHWGLYVNGACVDPVPWRYQGFE
jgi:murein DD-endopeptidase MepM/ murein hydrolase activator NlpD